MFGKTTKSYSEAIRRFCLTLIFYSRGAYAYIRSIFKFRLPSIRTIRSWYTSVNGSPGFTSEAIEALRLMVDEMKKNDELLITCLISDEMSIRPRSEWDPNMKEYTGFITAGVPEEYENALPLAKNVLVFMVSGMNRSFKVPVAYFLTTGLKTEERAALTQEVILRVSETGVIIACTTFDGLISNISMAKYLGADFDSDKPYFPNPYDKERKIFVILDPSHMVKLARNHFASKELHSRSGPIKWDFILALERIQRENSCNLGNKLKSKHIHWEANKMCVRLAVETMSDSVADSIEQLQEDGTPEFQESNATIEYIRVNNNLFDVMNSKVNHEGPNYKQPISESNEAKIFDYFRFAKNYLKTLEIKNAERWKNVFDTKAHTPFFGLYHNMISYENIYNEYVRNGPMKELYAFSTSQDHLESFFGASRRMNGCNTNPTPQQFRASYRKLLICNEVTTSEFSNCIHDATKILTISSRPPKLDNENNNEVDEIIPNIVVLHQNENRDSSESHSQAYLASIIENSVAKSIHRKGRDMCQKCIDVFAENEIIDDSLIRKKSETEEILQPCKSTMEILDVAGDVLIQFQNRSVSYQNTLKTILSTLVFDDLFKSSNFEEHFGTNHKNDLIKAVVETYLRIKSMSVADNLTKDAQGYLIRRVLTKQIHFAGQ